MPQTSFWRAVLIIALGLAIAKPAKADRLSDAGRNIVIGIVAVTAALAVVVTVVVIHYSKKRTITGCIQSGDKGMSVTDEKDQQLYMLSGNMMGVVSGNRMKLQGERIKPKGAHKTFVWEEKNVIKDFGVCQPR
ncbi:MAG: hypothetical protein WCD47_07555 [Candidatus Sulfotelmatobacter sp.]